MADTANQKISELPAVSSAASNDVLAGVKSNTTSKFPLSVLKTFFQSGLTKSNVGLGNVDNTSDANKPVSAAQQAAIDAAVQEAEAAIPAASSADPQMDGTASPGSSNAWSRGDHTHPSDTSRVPVTRTVNGKALSADIELNAEDIPYEGSVNGIVVTTVKGALDHIPTGSNSSPYMDGIPSAGGSYYFSKSDHVHPSDTSRVPINRSVNGKELRDDIMLSAADVGAASEGSIAPSELEIAGTNYAIGDHLMLGGVLYEVIVAISSGETITPGTNVATTTVVEITDGLDTRTTALETALDGLVSQLAQI